MTLADNTAVSSTEQPTAGSRRTPLFDLHVELGARMVDFAGWLLPVQYAPGIMAEHRHCRQAAGLFDVSHMGQLLIRGPEAAEAFERLVPGNIRDLAPGRARYTLFSTRQGGVIDDLIVSRTTDGLYVVVNAAGFDADLAHLRGNLDGACNLEHLHDRALLALQGPAAGGIVESLAPATAALRFMQTMQTEIEGVPCRISRLGYTGEDGFEISIAAERAEPLARRLLGFDEVLPVGLGARDSLRLEAGLCLYGHELSLETTPVEAGLEWAIGRSRRETGGFPGADVILDQLRHGAPRRLVGLRPIGRAPARDGTAILDGEGRPVGQVTSGGFGPTVDAPISMGYVEAAHAAVGTELLLAIRGRTHPATIVALPFVPHRYRH